jgi:hypothetical protein
VLLLSVPHQVHGSFDVLASEVRYLHFLQGSGAELAGACEFPAGLEQLLAREGSGEWVDVVDEDLFAFLDGGGGVDRAPLD